MRKWIGLGLALCATFFTLSGCGSDPVTVPDVRGIRLDDAHNKLKKVGFKEFVDDDKFGDRPSIFDSNWVVVGQSPKAGSATDAETKIKLFVAKPSDKGVRKLLPSDSPVLAELRKKDSKRAKEKAAQSKQDALDKAKVEQKRISEAIHYVDDLDPVARVAKDAIIQLGKFGKEVAAGRVSDGGLDSNVDVAHDAFETYDRVISLIDVPKGLVTSVDRLHGSIDDFEREALTLLSANGSGRTNSLKRFNDLLSQSLHEYNSALSDIYDGTSVSAPTVK